MKLFPFFAGALLVATITGCTPKPASRTAMTRASNPVVAHRGAWKAQGFPENSLASLRQAIELGCTGSEFDVWMTSDDSLIINHDPMHAKLKVETSTYAQLLAEPLANGEVLPTLRMYLAEGLRQNPSTLLVCEIKPSGISPARGEEIARRTVALVEAMGARPRTAYISFGYNICQEILRTDAKAQVQYLGGDKAPALLAADGLSGLDYHFKAFRKNPVWISEAKRLKLALNAWTVNETEDLNWLLDEQFDYITTNEPERALEMWAARKH